MNKFEQMAFWSMVAVIAVGFSIIILLFFL